jgi:hypothetical protein
MSSAPFKETIMFKHYLRIAVRNFLKHKSYSFINVAELTIKLACCFVIMLYVRHKLSYDRFHAKADRIYRLLHTPAQDPNRCWRLALRLMRHICSRNFPISKWCGSSPTAAA